MTGAFLGCFLAVNSHQGDGRGVGAECDCYARRTADLEVLATGETMKAGCVYSVVGIWHVMEEFPCKSEL